MTDVGRRGRCLLAQLVLSLVLGLLGMHALVVVDIGAPEGRAAVVSSSVARSGDAHGSVEASAEHAGASAPERHQHPGPHQLLHLCLAIVAAVGLVVLLLVAVVVGRPPRESVPGPDRGRRAPPVRPPPTSVRLALLCVMRN